MSIHQRMLTLMALTIVAVLALSSLAIAKPKTCSNFTGGSAGLVRTFSHVRAMGVSCKKAHEVVGTWANSGPGGTDLGFTCTAKSTNAASTYEVRCVEGKKKITAVDKDSA